MNHASPPPAAPGRRWWRDGMVWLIVGIVTLVVGGNAVMVWIAVDSRPSLVRRDYYEASRRVDDERAARQASDGLGWQVLVDDAGGTPGSVRLEITDAAGAPVTGLSGQVQAYRAADAALDQALDWQPDAAAPGVYRAVFPRPQPGLWRLTLDVSSGGRRLYKDVMVNLRAP